MSPARALRPRESLRIVANAAELTRAGVEVVLREARAAIHARGVIHVALAGGSTPRSLYRELALRGDEAGFERWHAWFGDERCVPPEHADSNYRMARESGLLARLPQANVHRLRGEAPDPLREAERYEKELITLLGLPPRLDLVLLGLGSDGHTASLFPGTAALAASGWITLGRAPKPPLERATLTFATLEQARALVFLVAGSDKTQAVTDALDDAAAAPVPARRAYPLDGTLLWLVERSAAAD